MNVRMVNAVFEDSTKTEFDPDTNTQAFIDRLPEYIAHGIQGFTISLQGGMPGYEGAVNSAFARDGSLQPAYLERVRRCLDAADPRRRRHPEPFLPAPVRATHALTPIALA
jgi:hypothetical protein